MGQVGEVADADLGDASTGRCLSLPLPEALAPLPDEPVRSQPVANRSSPAVRKLGSKRWNKTEVEFHDGLR